MLFDLHCATKPLLRPAAATPSRLLPRGLLHLNPLALAALCLFSRAHALDSTALPSGGSVGAGQGQIVAVDGGLRIDQASDRLTLNWGSFNIGSARSVQFAQPSRGASVLNRVAASGGSTEIAGRLSANGNVFLLNANGILFSSSARVDVGGLVASTLSLSDAKFLASDYTLSTPSPSPSPSTNDITSLSTLMAAGVSINSDTGLAGTVVNLGTLNAASGGSIALVAPRVGNAGSIVAQRGSVALAAGNAVTLDFSGDRLIQVAVTEGALVSAAVNGGLIQSDGGLVIMSARTAGDLIGSSVNNFGEIRAARVEQSGGVVRLTGDAEVRVDGTVVASERIEIAAGEVVGSGGLVASGTRGGVIDVRARSLDWSGSMRADGQDGAGGAVALRSESTLNLGPASLLTALSSGGAGGAILLDGGAGNLLLQGGVYADGARGGTIAATAANLALSSATLSASGIEAGGTIHLGGGWQGGGPLAHARWLTVDGESSLRADATRSGHGGELVLWSDLATQFQGSAHALGGPDAGDGGRIETSSNGALALGGTINAAARNSAGRPGLWLLDHRDIQVASTPLGNSDCCIVPPGPDLLEPAQIEAALANGTSVQLQASNDIVVDAPVRVVLQDRAASLSLQAGRSIHLNADLQLDRGDLTFTANDGAAVSGAGRDRGAGAATLDMQRVGDYASSIASGSGAVNLQMLAGTGAASVGTIRLNDVSAASIEVRGHAAAAAIDAIGLIELELNGVLSASAAGNALVVSARRLGFGATAQPFDTPNGRWLAYSDAPDGNRFRVVRSPGNLFGRSLADSPPDSIAASFGNRFVYAVTPTLDVTAQPLNRAYGEANLALAYKVSGLVAGDTAASALSGELSSTANLGSHAGNYTVGSGTLADRLGYGLAFQSAPAIVAPRAITLAVDDKQRGYGQSNPTTGTAQRVLAGTLVFDDVVSAIGVSSRLAATAHAGDSAPLQGHSVVVSGGSNASVPGDYAVTFLDGTLSVTPAPISLRVDDLTRLYGDANPSTGSVSLVGGSLYFGDRVGPIGVSSNLAAIAHAGTSSALNASAWSPTGGGNASLPGDYSVTWQSGTLSVLPRPLTLLVNDAARAYGDANPVSGSARLTQGSMVFGDAVGMLTLGTDLPAAAHAGSSAALRGSGHAPTGGSNASVAGDYAVRYEAGTLRVTPRPVTLALDDQTRAYGDANPALGSATVTRGSLAFGDTLAAVNVTSALSAGAHAGDSAALNGNGASLNSTISRQSDDAIAYDPGQLTVTPRAVGVQVQDQTRAYGDANPTLGSATISRGSLTFGDTLAAVNVTSALSAGAHAGDSAALNGNGASLNSTISRSSDYAIAYDPATLTVTPRAVGVQVQDQTRAYGDANPTLGSATISRGSLAFVDTLAAVNVASTLATTAHAGDSAALNGSGASLNSTASRLSDYAISYDLATLTVTPRAVTLAVDDQGRVFGEPNPVRGSATLAGGNLVFGDDITSVVVQSTLPGNAALSATAPLLGLTAALGGGNNDSRLSDYDFVFRAGRLGVAALPPSAPDSGVLGRQTGVSGVSAVLPMPPIPAAAEPPLLALAQPEQDSLAYQPERFLALVEARHDFFTGLFETSLQWLQRDPRAADLPPCPEDAEDRRGADDELCMPSDATRLALQGEGELDLPPTAAGIPADTGFVVAAPAPDAPPVVQEAPEAAPTAPAIRRKQAYLIGIDRYRGGIPALKTPVADTLALSRELEQRFGYEVELLQDASKRDIVALLKRIARDARPDDSVLLYYAGHGYKVEDTQAGYWIPSDASQDDPRGWISNADITQFLSLIAARQIILVADSCYSGTLAREERLDPDQVFHNRSQILANRAVVLMTSGGEEPVYDSGGGNHSIFAASLLDSLRQAGRSQIGSSLYADVKERVETRFPQYPMYGASRSAGHRRGGDYLFEQGGPPAAATLQE